MFRCLWLTSILILLLSCAGENGPGSGGEDGPDNGGEDGPEFRQQAVAAECSTETVETTQGAVCGATLETETGRDVEAFLGIPYGETTAGENRWEPPIPREPWAGTLEALKFGAMCPQLSDVEKIASPVIGDEDCLSLNIWRPKGISEGADVPVMVYIYGGGFFAGSSSLSVYDGSYLSTANETVVVSLDYRLGALGFLVLEDISGNFGFLDQQLAMTWVRHNIRSFGGDPEKVTLFGESAGAISVGLHLTSAPASRDLFRAGIMESNPYSLPLKDPHEATAVGKIFSALLGCSDTACLRSKSAEEVVHAQQKLLTYLPILWQGLAAVLTWAPVVDGTVIDEEPVIAAELGRLDKPLLFGTNRESGDYIYVVPTAMPEFEDLSAREYIAAITIFFGLDAPRVLLRYPPSTTESNWPLLGQVVTDYLFRCSNQYVAEQATSSVYGYQFAHVSSFNFNLFPGVYVPECDHLVCHGAELPYVFHTARQIGAEFEPAEAHLSSEFVGYWGRFARFLDPNGASAANPAATPWPGFSSQENTYLRLDLEISTLQNPYRSICPFWDRIGYDLLNPWSRITGVGLLESEKEDLQKDVEEDL